MSEEERKREGDRDRERERRLHGAHKSRRSEGDEDSGNRDKSTEYIHRKKEGERVRE